ncbi:PQQ-binding-like beta-propeller repeat protein [Kitasatospora sp. NPDC059817]|uniref:outer membrane protein assembly factor BamB family protein n=1 Tax=Kitasatospora sp. NPDC059817 TaxID=3346961 RepID=UPI003666EAA6
MAEGPVDSAAGTGWARRSVRLARGGFAMDKEAWMVVSGGVLGAMFASMGLAVLIGPSQGYGGESLDFMGIVSILGLMPCGAGLLWALLHPRRGFPAVAVGILFGLAVFVSFAGTGLNDAWEAPLDRPSSIRAVGSWTSGDVVVRVRPDQVVAYRGATGQVAWRWTPPGEDSVCAMSRGTGHGLGLLGHSPHDRPCAAVTALNLANGTAAWTAAADAPGRVGDTAAPDLLAVAGDEAVLQERTGWRAVHLADGRASWRGDADAGCAPLQVAGGAAEVVTVAQCGDAAPVLRSLAPADGQERTRVALPVTGGLKDVAVVSTEPLAVWVDAQGERGTHAVLSFDGAGRQRASIPVAGDEYDLDVMLGGAHAYDAFAARPLFGGVVVGDQLIVPGEKPDDVRISGGKNPSRIATGRLVAYSLADGGKRWTSGLDDQVTGLLVDGASVWALTRDKLTRVDAATGRKSSELDVNDSKSVHPVDLSVSGPGRFTVVAEDGTRDEPPARGMG